MKTRHKLSKLDLLDYALDGAVTRRGLWSGQMTEDEADDLARDIAEIERRIKLTLIASHRKKAAQEAGSSPVSPDRG